MQQSKNMFILNPEYYGAAIKEEEEVEPSTLSKVWMQLLLVFALFLSLFFIYKIVDRTNILSWNIFIQDRGVKEIVIKEEPMPIAPSLVKKEVVKKEVTPTVTLAPVEVKKVKSVEKPVVVKPKASFSPKGEDLSKEYIELVKKTLGNN